MSIHIRSSTLYLGTARAPNHLQDLRLRVLHVVSVLVVLRGLDDDKMRREVDLRAVTYRAKVAGEFELGLSVTLITSVKERGNRARCRNFIHAKSSSLAREPKRIFKVRTRKRAPHHATKRRTAAKGNCERSNDFPRI